MHIAPLELMSYYIDLFPVLSLLGCLHFLVQDCAFFISVFLVPQMSLTLCVSLVTKEEEGRHVGRRRDHGGVSTREGKLRNW